MLQIFFRTSKDLPPPGDVKICHQNPCQTDRQTENYRGPPDRRSDGTPRLRGPIETYRDNTDPGSGTSKGREVIQIKDDHKEDERKASFNPAEYKEVNSNSMFYPNDCKGDTTKESVTRTSSFNDLELLDKDSSTSTLLQVLVCKFSSTSTRLQRKNHH